MFMTMARDLPHVERSATRSCELLQVLKRSLSVSPPIHILEKKKVDDDNGEISILAGVGCTAGDDVNEHLLKAIEGDRNTNTCIYIPSWCVLPRLHVAVLHSSTR